VKIPRKKKKRIPKGRYCYNTKKICPFWSINKNFPEQNNGYCSIMRVGDWNIPGLLLWDQVKECGIKE
jgi:hypothetical protein